MTPLIVRASRMMLRWATMKPRRIPGEMVFDRLPT